MYQPSEKILYNYAKVLIDFALGNGKGINKKDIVYVHYEAPSHLLALQVYKRILECGAYPITKVSHEDFAKVFYETATDNQLVFFPKVYMKALIDTIDHRMYLISDDDPMSLSHIDPKKLMKGQSQMQQVRKWVREKEDAGKLTWTLALYGTPGMAREAQCDIKEYWEQIENACFLNTPDPVNAWKKIFAELEKTKKKLNAFKIAKLHLTAKDTDLWLTLGADRRFIGGSGNNIPSFELFTSPDWRGTEGKIFFDLPLFRFGTIARDIYLEFKSGSVTKVKAVKNQKLIEEMIKQKNADKVGEYSLTDRRFSKINRFMANTLYDENFGGKYGNTHLALGSSYHDTFRGNVKSMKPNDWEARGFNESVEHTDIIQTLERTVEATLTNGVKKVIYKDGEFTL